MGLDSYFGILLNVEEWVDVWIKEYEDYYSRTLKNVQNLGVYNLLSREDLSKGIVGVLSYKNYLTYMLKEQTDILTEISRYLDITVNFDILFSNLVKFSHYQDEDFGIKKMFSDIKESLLRKQQRYKNQIEKLSIFERERLEEAICTSIKGWHFSSIMSSVVSLEYRLFNLLKKENIKFLESKRRKMNFTFGQLIKIYLENKEEFSNIIPSKYDHLLQLCMSYRNYSAHAKDEKMNNKDSQAIINLTFSFLFDQRCM